MSKLVLVRHSTPALDESLPPTDWALSAEGRVAERELAELLSGISFARVLTSPERKARETAEILAAASGLAAIVEPDLREHEWTSKGFHSTAVFAESLASLFRVPGERVFGDETANAAFDQFEHALDHAAARFPGSDLLMVTHGTALTIYTSQRFGIDPMVFWSGLAISTALVVEANEWRLVPPAGARPR